MPADLPIAIVGAGPVGLVAAAHVLARGGTPLILESGDRAGWHVRQWSHVRLFSRWDWLTDPVSAGLLERAGAEAPRGEEIPTGAELLERFIDPLAERTPLRDHLLTGRTVVHVSRAGMNKLGRRERWGAAFEISVLTARGLEIHHARAVLDATGSWGTPNPLGASGCVVPGEVEHAAAIAYRIPDVRGSARSRYVGQRTAVIGSGHSAANVLIELAELARETRRGTVTWIVRGPFTEDLYGRGHADALHARAELGRRVRALVESGRVAVVPDFATVRVTRAGEAIRLHALADRVAGPFDELIVVTGFRPDHGFARELHLALDPVIECPASIAPHIDPAIHTCGTAYLHGYAELRQPEQDYFIVGMKSYGRAPSFDLITGYEQARSVVAGVMNDMDAALRIEAVHPGAAGVPTPAGCGGPPVCG